MYIILFEQKVEYMYDIHEYVDVSRFLVPSHSCFATHRSVLCDSVTGDLCSKNQKTDEPRKPLGYFPKGKTSVTEI